jgi:hypothetical protein
MLACDEDAQKTAENEAAAASATPPPPVDRLAPGELVEGTESAYGLVLPRGMKVLSRFEDAVHAKGKMRPEHVANYVRKRVDVARVELGAARTIFPNVRIKDGNRARRYRIEVVRTSAVETKLELYDVTPPPKVEAKSQAERLRRAGFNPDGTPLNPMQLE